MKKYTALDVAKWMVSQLERDTWLYQQQAAFDIATQFGEEFVFVNANGNQGIAKPVLDHFNKLTGDRVVWERGTRRWRPREDYDEPGRMQR